jgi:FkbM family methyltransferase
MRIGNRSIVKIFGAMFNRVHWIALWNMMFTYRRFFDMFRRYVFGAGGYPYAAEVRVPAAAGGVLRIMTYYRDDVLTVNEVFCRKDYGNGKNVRVVLDIGSNIGVSALYFLTRNGDAHCYLYEPVPQNIANLRQNLAGFADRYTLYECAVADEAGTVEFGVEETGRYGGIGAETGNVITVECRNINDAVADVLNRHGRIDVLKIDTEGAEIRTVTAIRYEYLNKIAAIYIEAKPAENLLPRGMFRQRQYGAVCQMINIVVSTENG